jgi:hypothetical protein
MQIRMQHFFYLRIWIQVLMTKNLTNFTAEEKFILFYKK